MSGRSSEHVLIDDLSDGESPRLEGLDDEHVRRLAKTEEPLPPIVVHRAMMQVVDGRHRLRAARLRGAVRIAASFLDCPADDVFVEAVRANSAHGLPLSLPDRKAAAARIVRSHPRWSDRTIASVTGLSHKTVGKIRREQPDGGVPHLERTGSAVAAEIIRRNPEMPLRQVAKAAGVAVSTAHSIRRRVTQAGQELPARCEQVRPENPGNPDATTVLRMLSSDPALRYTDTGRALLRLIGAHPPTEDEWRRLGEVVPAHCSLAVADLARDFAAAWDEFATRLACSAGYLPQPNTPG
ncbi:ParB N-terminal domain-containing protein [Lentzea sp. NEAU-D13]|uniref:ParB N-terminal domain-containing protein n=1 Tax=Lentzea alba TaxID=2714351 RepID=A0A7C9VTV8_9PSEU|nr:ParB N-terminal domain-containing protein [Lentzea alba]NGY62255.1 ParB N-terminal domain-containing protein [Lentzea alba]